MKTALAIVLAAALLVAGCNEKKSASTPATTPPGTPEKKMDSPTGTLPGAAVTGQPVTTASGLQYYDLTPGTGASPQEGQMVNARYTGWLTNGTQFDSGTYEFPLGKHKVVAGWDEGFATMKVGGKRKLIVPPALAYGDRGFPGRIPPNSTLVFDVELVGVK